MKHTLFLFLLAAVMVCCGKNTQSNLTWHQDTLSYSTTDDVIFLMYPVAEGGAVADSINAAINDYLKNTFLGEADSGDGRTVEEALKSIMAEKNRDSIMAGIPYQMHSDGRVYDNGKLVSIWMQSYSYQGGAHGITTGTMLNFNARNGKSLRAKDLFKDTTKLIEINHTAFGQFLAEKGIDDIANTLFVAPDELPLPQNIGLDSTGLRMLYNPYEIAPYVFGQSEYTIPYEDVRSILEKIAKP